MSPVRLDTEFAQSLEAPTEIVIIDKNDGRVLERVNLVRYAGHYRPGGIDAFVVRDSRGKVRVRSERDLGLSPASKKVAYRADTFIDLRSA